MAVSGTSVGSGTSRTKRTCAPSQIRARTRASAVRARTRASAIRDRPAKTSSRPERERTRSDLRGEHRALRSGDRTLVTEKRDPRVAEDHRASEDHPLAVREVVDAQLVAHPRFLDV